MKELVALFASALLCAAMGVGCREDDARTSARPEHAEAEPLYACGMHPQVVQHGPGTCSICGMDLTPTTTTNPGQERTVKYWVAPMNPSFVSDAPGKSPMGMDLVPVYADAAPGIQTGVVSIDPVVV